MDDIQSELADVAARIQALVQVLTLHQQSKISTHTRDRIDGLTESAGSSSLEKYSSNP